MFKRKRPGLWPGLILKVKSMEKHSNNRKKTENRRRPYVGGRPVCFQMSAHVPGGGHGVRQDTQQQAVVV